jgi:hypothetical protein
MRGKGKFLPGGEAVFARKGKRGQQDITRKSGRGAAS